MPLEAVVWPTARANKGGRNRVLPSDRADTSDDPHDSSRVRRQFRLKCMYVIKWNILTMAHGYYHQRIGGRPYREAVADGGVAIYFCYPQLEWGRSQEQQQVPQVLHKMCVVCRSRQRLGMALGTSWLAMRGGSWALR